MAAKYFIVGSGDGKFGTAANWASTDGGIHIAETVPTVADDVFYTSNSPNCTIDASNRAALTLTTTGYTNTITCTFRLTVSGAITLSATTTQLGPEYIAGLVAATHTMNGASVANFWLQGSVTHVLADNWTCVNYRFGTSTNVTIVNGNQITITGNLDFSQSTSGALSGTTNLIMTGTGSVLLWTSTGNLSNNLTINTAGTITFGTGGFRYRTGTFTYTAGTVDATNCDLTCALSTTLALGSAVKWKTVTLNGAGAVFTLNSDLWCLGLYTSGASTNSMTLTGSKFYIGGGITFTGSSSAISGTTELVLNGTGTINSLSTGSMANPFTFDAGVGTVTVSGTGGSNLAVKIDLSKCKHLSGNVITDAGTWLNPSVSRGMVVRASSTY